MRVIGADGSQVGILPTEDALARARDADLDLVEVASQTDPPVCKIMDYGKFRYEQSIKAKEARRRRSADEVKEMKFRPKIGPHDYDTKKRHVEEFLKHGHRVKVTLQFRGREMAHTELGHKVLQQLESDLSELAVAENRPKLDGRQMTMMFAPSRRRPGGDKQS